MVAGFITLSLFIVGVELSVPKFIQYFIDVLLPSKDTHAFLTLLLILGVLIVLMFMAVLYRNRFQRIVQEKAARDLQFSLFDHLRHLGFSYYERNPVGETLSLFNSEVSAVQQIYHRYFPGLIITGVTFMVSTVLMLSIHVTLSLIAIPCFLSYYLIGPYFEKKAAVLGREAQQKRTGFNKKIYDTVSALLEMRVYGCKDWDMDKGRAKQETLHRTINNLHFMAYSRGLVRRVSVQLGAVAVFAYGTYLLSYGDISTGSLVAFMFFYFRMMQDMTFIVTMTSEQQVLMNQVDKLFDFIKEKPDVQEPHTSIQLDAIQGELAFKQVHFHYPSQPELIKNFTLHISSGERVAFVGTSGNGKSTLLKLLGRFYDPLQGEITLDGIPLNQLSLKQVRETMGFVFQETYLFGASIKENIRFGNPQATDREIEEAAKAANAHEFIHKFPDKYDTFVGERGVRLSGGQQQRISIARMFIKNPKIILLDEATSSLDNVSEWEVQQALRKLFLGRTTVAIAHRLSTVKDFDRIIVVENGGISEAGTYKELMEQKGTLYRLALGEEEH
jgi:ATP-binding cassette subfamily B protein